jgi:hypothetical protein
MTTMAAKAPARKSTGRKATRRTTPAGEANGGEHVEEAFVPPTEIRAPEEVKVHEPVAESHPIYGDKKLYTYRPKDGSEAIVFPHIATCRPTAKFFYLNRNKDEMHQAFAWMDLCEIPDHIGARLFDLPDEEQGTLLKEWFGGLSLTPSAEVSPPGES